MITKNVDKTKPLSVVNDFFADFKDSFGASAATPKINEVEKHLSKNLQMFNNGQLVVSGGANYINRLQKFQKKYSRFEISDPLEKPLISNNQVTLYYRLDLTTHNGKHEQVYIMGLFTIENDKIERWVEVTHEKGSGQWDH